MDNNINVYSPIHMILNSNNEKKKLKENLKNSHEQNNS